MRGSFKKLPRISARFASLVLLLALSAKAAAQIAQPWPQADRLFRSDPRWLGGDAAFSIDLGKQRVLWLFGDSFIAPWPGATRAHSIFIRNSAAIQTGYDPSRATITFYEDRQDGRVTDLATSRVPGTWLWPMHGIRLGDRLLLFYMRVAPDSRKDSLGFQLIGWNGFIIDHPDMAPTRWHFEPLDSPHVPGDLLIGMSIVRDGNYVYAFALDDPKHDAYLLRWSAHDAARGRLSAPQWWCGADRGWSVAWQCRQVVIANAGSEFSVQHSLRGGFIEVNSAGFGASTIAWRHAAHLEGPWSGPQNLYRPPESNAPDAFVYGAKSHPELAGANLIITYTANSSDTRLATDMSIYFPRFVRILDFDPHGHHAQ